MMLSMLSLESDQCTQLIYCSSKGSLMRLSENVTVQGSVLLAGAKWDVEPDMKNASWLSKKAGGT
jgi:hypothetical protein